MVLGIDLAGVVTELGPGAAGFNAGDEVYGMAGGVGDRAGSLADDGKITPVLDAEPYDLTTVAAAHQAVAAGSARGKVVVRVRPGPDGAA